jgi:predicted flavoprotein YhiN
VTGITAGDDGFTVTCDPATTDAGAIRTRRVILCTGGKSLPKSGSDGGGFVLAQSLGHSLAEPHVPALVPLVLAPDHWIPGLAGLTLPTAVTLATATGKRLVSFTGSTLCTHVGLSGPAILDISRHGLVARHADPGVTLALNWLPGMTTDDCDRLLVEGQSRGAVAVLRDLDAGEDQA